MRDFECAGNIAGNRRVNSDARAAIHPGRRARRRSGFRAVFVLVFVGGYYALWFFGHSLRISRKKQTVSAANSCSTKQCNGIFKTPQTRGGRALAPQRGVCKYNPSAKLRFLLAQICGKPLNSTPRASAERGHGMKDVAQRLRRILGAVALCAALALVAASPGISAPPREPAALSQQDRLDIFERVWRDIRDLYYDPAFHGVNWDQIQEQYLPEVRAVQNDDDFYAIIRQMTSVLHDAHTRFYSPDQWKRIKMHERAGFGFTVAEVEGKTAITTVERNSDAERAGIQPGMIVVSVDGKPVVERIAD